MFPASSVAVEYDCLWIGAPVFVASVDYAGCICGFLVMAKVWKKLSKSIII